MAYPSKLDLLGQGQSLIGAFCTINQLEIPPVNVRARDDWPFEVCAYYRPIAIHICLERTAHIGTTGMAWSFPGYTVDRTPYGVLAHELGHHADVSTSTVKRSYFGDYSQWVRKESGESKLTNYCPNDAEWFAEMFRLFVTNPDLLHWLRPRTWAYLINRFHPVEFRSWREVLASAPERTIQQAERKINDVQTRSNRARP